MVSLYLKSFMAGVCISIGCVAYMAVGGGTLGAFLFSIGLLSICAFSFALFTGKVCYVKPTKQGIFDVIFVLLVNMLGTLLMGFLIRLSLPKMIDMAQFMCDKKLSEGFRVIPLGFLCNIMIFFAVYAWKEVYTNSTARVLILVLCVMVFILCGFEHSIANSFYMTVSGYITKPIAWGYIGLNVVGNAIGGIVTFRIVNGSLK